MIGLFKQKSPGNIILLLIFALMVKLPLFLFPKNIKASPLDGGLYQWLLSIMPSENGFITSLLAFFLLYVQSLMVNYMVNEFRMTTRQNYLQAMSYLLITSVMH